MSEDNLTGVECPEITSAEESVIQLTENGLESFEILCRLCANRSENLIPIYSEEGITNDLADKMNLYLPIKVCKTDVLPLQCCFQCASTVLTWHELVVASVEADRRLREIKSEIEKQIEDEESIEAGPSQVENIDIDRCTRPVSLNVFKEENNAKTFTSNKFKKENKTSNDINKIIEEDESVSVDRDDSYDNESLSKPVRKTFQCAECDRHFFQKPSLMRHIRIHKNERPFTCDVCGKGFRDKSGLTRHIRHVHERTKDFSCDICLKSFASAATRDDHRRSHTKECPFTCKICGKSFGRKASLYIHSKIHSDVFPFDCNVCNKKFHRRQELMNHISTHSGEKRFQCVDCGKLFRMKKALNSHKLIHSDIKPFSCSVCGISYRQARYLRKHLSLKHSPKIINHDLK